MPSSCVLRSRSEPAGRRQAAECGASRRLRKRWRSSGRLFAQGVPRLTPRKRSQVVLRGLDPRIRVFASTAPRGGWPSRAKPSPAETKLAVTVNWPDDRVGVFSILANLPVFGRKWDQSMISYLFAGSPVG